MSKCGGLLSADTSNVRMLWCTTVLLFIFFIIGCHPLPPGDVSAIHAISDRPQQPNVYLVRGWRDLWSEGIDQLAQQLRGSGVHAQLFRAAQWRELANALNKASPSTPLVFIGFSYGADDVVQIARELQKHDVAVDLLITIDPVTPPRVPTNVKVCYNYYQSNGFWDIFPWLRGIPLKSDGALKLLNMDLRKDRRDLLEPNTSHSTIAANAKLHEEIVCTVLETTRSP